MVKYADPELDLIFGALADPARRELLNELTFGERSVSELAEPFCMSLPAVMKHLSVLQRAGLIAQRKEGRSRLCTLRPEPLQVADSWLSRYETFWNSALESLGRYLNEREPSTNNDT